MTVFAFAVECLSLFSYVPKSAIYESIYARGVLRESGKKGFCLEVFCHLVER